MLLWRESHSKIHKFMVAMAVGLRNFRAK